MHQIRGCVLAEERDGHVAKEPAILIAAYMQFRLPNSRRYLVNAKPGTNHSTDPTNPNGNSKW